MTVALVAMAVVLALMLVLVAGLLRSHAEILRALHALGITEDELRGSDDAPFRTSEGVPRPRGIEPGPPGAIEAAHDISGATPSGGARQVSVIGTGHQTLLAFLSSSCLTCRDFWSAFARGVVLPDPDARLIIVTQGPEAESPDAVASLAPRSVTVVMSSQAWSDYAVPVAPYFVLVDGEAGEVMGEGAAASWDKVEDLLTRAVRDAGSVGAAGGGRRRGSVRESDTDAALASAGIEPGDPRLHHDHDHDAAQQDGADSS